MSSVIQSLSRKEYYTQSNPEELALARANSENTRRQFTNFTRYTDMMIKTLDVMLHTITVQHAKKQRAYNPHSVTFVVFLPEQTTEDILGDALIYLNGKLIDLSKKYRKMIHGHINPGKIPFDFRRLAALNLRIGIGSVCACAIKCLEQDNQFIALEFDKLKEYLIDSDYVPPEVNILKPLK